MTIRWRRIIVGAVFVVLLPVALLGVLTMAGPADRDAAIRFAAALARWPDFGAGLIVAAVIGWLVARPLAGRHLQHGLLVGLLAAVLDAGILVLAAAPFELLHLASMLGVIGFAALGARLAASPRFAITATRADPA